VSGVTRHLWCILTALALVAASTARAEEASEGKLFVVSYPRGEVVVDGKPTAIRTPNTGFSVPSGEREVVVRWGEGVVSSPQTVVVREGKTSHLYFRRELGSRDAAACDQGRDEACFGLVAEAVQQADASGIVARAETYLARFPEGAYAKVAQSILDSREIILEQERRALRPIYLASAVFFGVLLAGLALWRLRARGSVSRGTPRGR
jgi:hypothetical protein